MNTEIIVAVLALAGTLVGSCGGVLASQRLTAFRLKALEEKVAKHNNLIERTCVLEAKVNALSLHAENR